ncbi:hypothetical protein ACLOJK_040366 [Asimina triloba]
MALFLLCKSSDFEFEHVPSSDATSKSNHEDIIEGESEWRNNLSRDRNLTVIFGQLQAFNTLKHASDSPLSNPLKATSVISGQQDISRASRFLQFDRMQLTEASDMFEHQSNLRCLRVSLRAMASTFIDSSEKLRHPPTISDLRFLHESANESMDSSPTS